jgi:signal peptidase I
MSLRRALVGTSPARTLLRAALLAAVLLAGSRFVLSPVRAVGISMLPAYADGQLLLLNRLAYHLGEPARGDVVAIRLSGDAAVLVKRIIGLPGERVGIVDGRVFVDDELLAEPYVALPCDWTVEEVALAPDEYYVVGDNRSMPVTLHDFGTATRDRLLGRLVW